MIFPNGGSPIFDFGVGSLIFFGAFGFGLIIGSFLNVCIYRLPGKGSLAWPSSHCPQCGHRILFRDNIPIVSYFLLKGHCRFCRVSISSRYPLVEFLTGLLFALVVSRYDLTPYTIFSFGFTAILIVATFIDLEHRIIPNGLNYFGMVLAGMGLIFSFMPISPVTGLIGFFLGGGIFFLVALASPILFKKEGMGGGDIKFIAFIGLFLGWQKVLVTIFLGSLFGAVLGVIMIAVGASKRGELIPFGPYLACAAFIVFLWGSEMIGWYLGMFL